MPTNIEELLRQVAAFCAQAADEIKYAQRDAKVEAYRLSKECKAVADEKKFAAWFAEKLQERDGDFGAVITLQEIIDFLNEFTEQKQEVSVGV